VLDDLGLAGRDFVLATLHRAENTDVGERLNAALEGLGSVGKEVPVVLPLHPRTKSALERHGIAVPESLTVIQPLGYLDMVKLESAAIVVATDSGGVQKEAFFHRVPCVTLRDETEWVELVEAGWNRLAPPICADDVSNAIREAMGSSGEEIEPYGRGASADAVVRHLTGA
jgi:UDP-GlcNAc3NAcA epimerase